MKNVPCGQNMGHGSSCTEGYLCDSCNAILELNKQIKKYGWHSPGCPAADASVCEICNCGFDKVLED